MTALYNPLRPNGSTAAENRALIEAEHELRWGLSADIGQRLAAASKRAPLFKHRITEIAARIERVVSDELDDAIDQQALCEARGEIVF